MTEVLSEIARQGAAGTPLDRHDRDGIVSSLDLIGLGLAADEARRRRHGDRTTFVQVAEVRLADAAADTALPGEAGELRLVGEPDGLEAAATAVRAAVDRAGGVPVTGFDLAALYRACGEEVPGLVDALATLADAGLSALNETPLDALSGLDRVESVLEALGASPLRLNRLGMGAADPTVAVSLFERVASWGTLAGVCRSLAPLPGGESASASTGYGDLRQVALARLLVDNIESIQVDWSRHGPKLAQVALTFGANDLDAVRAETDEEGWRRAPREEVRRNIVAAGFTAIRRDGGFEAL